MGRLLPALLSAAVALPSGITLRQKRWVRLEGEYCRREHLPQTEFARYDDTCDGMADTALIDGTTCTYECIDSIYMDGVTHNIACTCLYSSETIPLCYWQFQGDDTDNTFMCGKRLYRNLYLENKANYDQILSDGSDTQTAVETVIDGLATTISDLIALHEPAITTLHADTETERNTRISEDAAINSEIDQKILDMNALLNSESLDADSTITNYISTLYDDLKVDVVTELSLHESQLTDFVDSQLSTLEADNQARLNAWKQDLVDYTAEEAAAVKAVLDDIISDAYDAGVTAIDNKIVAVEPTIEQDIITAATTLQGDQASALGTGLFNLQTDVADYISTESTATQDDLEDKVEVMRVDLLGQVQNAIDLQNTIQATAAEELQNTLKTSLEADISAMQTQLEDQIVAESPVNRDEAMAYIDAEHEAVHEDINQKLEDTQADINAKNAIAREDAIRRAQIYADDIQRVLEFDLQSRIDGERDKIRAGIDESEASLNQRLTEVEEKVTNDLAEADLTYNNTMVTELDNIFDMVTESNSTAHEDLDELHAHYCRKINSAGDATKELILGIKSSLAAKIEKLVNTVQYEMNHSKRQIGLLRANSFF